MVRESGRGWGWREGDEGDEGDQGDEGDEGDEGDQGDEDLISSSRHVIDWWCGPSARWFPLHVDFSFLLNECAARKAYVCQPVTATTRTTAVCYSIFFSQLSSINATHDAAAASQKAICQAAATVGPTAALLGNLAKGAARAAASDAACPTVRQAATEAGLPLCHVNPKLL